MMPNTNTLSIAQLIEQILAIETGDTSHHHTFIERLLAQANGVAGLKRADVKTFIQKQEDLDDLSKRRLLALCELLRRFSQDDTITNTIHRIEDVLPHVLEMSTLSHEEIRIILLDSAQQIISIATIYRGTAYATVVRTGEIYRQALLYNSSSIILVHNHPSGDPSPSLEDVELTQALVAAGHLLDIQLIDHIIIGRKGWRSLKQMGLGFE